MITAFLLLPVVAILVWLYWYLLPARSWKIMDSLTLFLVLLGMTLWILLLDHTEIEDAGPLFVEIVSVVGAYAILIIGLTVGLWWRRHQVKPHQ